MSEFAEWVEERALENLRFHIQSAEMISKEANTTLTVFLAGFGGASAYTVKLADAHASTWLLSATIAFGICLLVLSGLLILFCLKIEVIPAPTNEPRNLNQPSFSLQSMREDELENLQGRIDETAKRNERVAERLNRIRLCALLTPVIAAAVALAAWVSL